MTDHAFTFFPTQKKHAICVLMKIAIVDWTLLYTHSSYRYKSDYYAIIFIVSAHPKMHTAKAAHGALTWALLTCSQDHALHLSSSVSRQDLDATSSPSDSPAQIPNACACLSQVDGDASSQQRHKCNVRYVLPRGISTNIIWVTIWASGK